MLKIRVGTLMTLGGLAALGLAACGNIQLPYTDSFDETSGRWMVGERGAGEIERTGGELTIRVDEPYTDVWSTLPVNEADVVIEADAHPTFGTFQNDYGVMCRYADGAFYYFALSADGYAAILWVDSRAEAEQTFTVLAPEGGMMAPFEVINTGYGTNHIRAACIGSELTFEVNGEEILSVTDERLARPGDVGLAAGTFERGGVRVNFDNVTVSPGR